MQGVLSSLRSPSRRPVLRWACLAGASLLALTACRARQVDKKARPGSQIPPKPAPVKILYPAAPGSFVRVVARLRPSLINLHARSPVAGGPATTLPPRRGADDPFYAASPLRDRVEKSLGTAVILDRKGHALTAMAILGQATEFRARLQNGQVLPVQLVGRDVDTGIAVVRLQLPQTGKPVVLTPATYGDSAQLRPGDWVAAVGDPFGMAPYVSAGLVSSPGASKGVTLTRPGYFSFISTDARINAANVGGALINTSGEVVGINVQADQRRRAMSFAVPINLIRDVLPVLLKHGRVTRSWVGIYAKPVTEAQATKAGLGKARGALVSEVIAGGPAAQAGLRVGDIVLQFDGKPVTRHQDLAYAAARSPSGKTVLVKVWRGGRQHVMSLRLQRKPQ